MLPLTRTATRARRSARAPVIYAGLALACIWAALPVAGAQAATTHGVCPETTLVHPFTEWGDNGYYSLVPGGGFEPAETRWSYAGGAGVAVGSEPWNVSGTPNWFSAVLPTGGSMQAPFVCVEPNDRTFRFFMRAASTSASVSVRLVYRSVAGLPVVVASKTLTVGSNWELSPVLHTGAALASTISLGAAQLALGFSSVKGVVRIDDVYLDPRMR
jgi:hypothetical protein